MVFSSIPFIFFFFPLCLLFYYIVPFKLKNYVLLFFSLVFYAWGEHVYVFLMIFLVLVVVFVAVFSGHFFNLDLAKRKSSMDTAKKEMMDKMINGGSAQPNTAIPAPGIPAIL